MCSCNDPYSPAHNVIDHFLTATRQKHDKNGKLAVKAKPKYTLLLTVSIHPQQSNTQTNPLILLLNFPSIPLPSFSPFSPFSNANF